MKLLLVDDERIIREGIEHMIPYEALGLRLTASCANAFEALDSITDDMPDILLTDIKMPRMDGLELIARALELNPSLECIVLSGYDEFAFARRALKMGVREYLLKPCARAELEEALVRVRDIVARRKRGISQLDELRRARAELLIQRLELLRPDEATGAITPAQVCAVVEATEGGDVLRDAYVYLIAHSSAGTAAPEWGMGAIQQAYVPEDALSARVAEGLTRMLAGQAPRRAFVEQMCTYIHAHFANPELSLQYLADNVVHMNADYIRKAFAQDTGMKLSAYLLRVRMERAKSLISAPEESTVYQVAEQVGLANNPQYFSQLFRKYTGMTPKEYRRQAHAVKNP